jgi:hypothetical protein
MEFATMLAHSASNSIPLQEHATYAQPISNFIMDYASRWDQPQRHHPQASHIMEAKSIPPKEQLLLIPTHPQALPLRTAQL